MQTILTPETKHAHPLASFCERPEGLWFESKENDEEILLFLRKHFITNVPWMVTTLLLLIIPFLIFLSVGSTDIFSPFITILPSSYLLPLMTFYVLAVLAYAFIQFITWFFNASIITNKRVIDIDFSGLVYHDVAATKIDLIQDVDYKQVGVIQSMFNYGDVFVQTASKSLNFDFLSVPKPLEASRVIEDLIGKNP